MTAADPDSRYVTDIPYARRFVRELSPAWLDFTALICGFAPPARESAFAWCELGCGHGVTPAFLAAMAPQATFYGFDLMPDHIGFARALCRDAGIENAEFHALDFAAASALDLPEFDYIVAHGVYSWVDAAARADLRRFLQRHLKPGGLVYLSYDCQPGWAADMPLQHLLRMIAERAHGDSIARFESADRVIRGMMAADAAVLRLGAVGREWETLREKLPPAYFVHEFLPPGWQPLYVHEVRRAMAEIGLTPVGSATIRENVDAFTLDRAARDLIAANPDPDIRELMRDYFLMKRFRRDVYGGSVARLGDARQRQRVLGTRFLAAVSDDALPQFEDPTAKWILELLAAGPAAPTALLAEGIAPESLAAQTLALVAGGRIWPVEAEADAVSVASLNAVLRKRVGGPDEIGFVALPAGTAIELSGERLQDFRRNGTIPSLVSS